MLAQNTLYLIGVDALIGDGKWSNTRGSVGPGWKTRIFWTKSLASLHFLRFNNNGGMFTRQRCKCFDICPPLVYQLSASYHGSSDRTLKCSQPRDLLNNHTTWFSMFQTGINSPFTISTATICLWCSRLLEWLEICHLLSNKSNANKSKSLKSQKWNIWNCLKTGNSRP